MVFAAGAVGQSGGMSTYVGNTSYNGLTLSTGTVDPVKTPAGILATRAVETKDGWVGQVIVDKVIVWESEPFVERDEDERGPGPETLAVRAANDRVIGGMRSLFQD